MCGAGRIVYTALSRFYNICGYQFYYSLARAFNQSGVIKDIV